MNAPRFSVPVDQDDLAKQSLTAGLTRPSITGAAGPLPGKATGLDAAHHGARDSRRAARERSERDHARGGRTSKGRSYAFRRS